MSIKFLNEVSIKAITMAIINEATITTTALFCSSFHVGHVTLLTSSLIASSKYVLILISLYLLAREERLELPTPGFGDRCSTN